MKIICVAGLPCSGKSFYAQKLKTERSYEIIDDPSSLEKDVYPIIDQITINGCIIIDPNFVYTNTRMSTELIFFKKCNFKNIEWIFFENNPQACLKNYERRKKQGDLRLVKEKIIMDSKYYLIPANAKYIPVWGGDE